MTKPGESFEVAVSQFLENFDRNAKVEHDVKVPDRRTGTPRQVDVLITGRICGHPVKIACSCKDWAAKLDIGDVDTFKGEMDAVGACTGILYARSGFTGPAVDAAKCIGISCCQLYQNEPADVPHELLIPTYCSVPRYKMLSTGHLRMWGFTTWGDALRYVPMDSQRSIGRQLTANMLQHPVSVESQSLLPATFSAAIELSNPGGDRPAVSVGLLCDWMHYSGRMQSYSLDGAYSHTAREFMGSQSAPPIDTHYPPGGGWTRLPPHKCEVVQSGICVSLYNDADDLLERLIEAVGMQSIYPNE